MLLTDSCIYGGTMVHDRALAPVHRFRYRLRLLWLNLDQLDGIVANSRWWSSRRFALAWFRRRDYLDQPQTDLKTRALQWVEKTHGVRMTGPVCVLTSARLFGLAFNPLTLFFCFTNDGLHTPFVVAEVRNTPWLQRHIYVLDLRDPNKPPQHPKNFHVSPFLPMDLFYHWRIDLNGERLRISITNTRNDLTVFRAALKLEREALPAQILDGRSLDRELWRHLPQGWKTLTGIYWQALKMLARRAHFYGHPG